MFRLSNKRRAFTLVELLTAIAILASILTVALFYVGGYLIDIKLHADKQTLNVLNDAINRYKNQGGNINALTSGAPIKNILAKLQAPIVWFGITHQVLQPGKTYFGRSIDACGTLKHYRFIRYDTYRAEENATLSDLNPATATVSTYAGTVAEGSTLGNLSTVQFSYPRSLIFDSSSNLLVFDFFNNRITKIAPDGNVSVFNNGTGNCYQMAKGPDGKIYIASYGDKCVYQFDSSGNKTVFAGIQGTAGILDGYRTSATFRQPCGLTFDNSGNMYIGDYEAGTIRKVDTSGQVTTLKAVAGTPRSLAYDSSGNSIFIANGSGAIQKLHLDDLSVEVFGVGYYGIYSLIISPTNKLYYVIPWQIFSMPLTGGSSTLITGSEGVAGHADGPTSSATFEALEGMVFDSLGNLFVSHGWGTSSHLIRKISNQ